SAAGTRPRGHDGPHRAARCIARAAGHRPRVTNARVDERQGSPMDDIWERFFAGDSLHWGRDPTQSAQLTVGWFADRGARHVLIPGFGYGRNALPFLDRGMSVVGIEISETAIEQARSQLGLECPIHHGSVADMPFDSRRFDGVFCHGLLYLLDAAGRDKLVRDCVRQLHPGGQLVFSVVSKAAPMYGQGTRLAEDWYETHPGIRIYFYDAVSLQ